MPVGQPHLAAKPNYSHQISHSLWLLGKLLDFKATKFASSLLGTLWQFAFIPIMHLPYLHHIYLHILSTFQDRCCIILCFSGFSTFQVYYLVDSH